METKNLFFLEEFKELLQYFTGNNVVFASADNSAALENIGVGFTEGDIVSISGSNQTPNNKEWVLGTVTSGKIILVGAVTGDSAANTTKIAQVVYGRWHDVSCFAKVVGSITSSGNCTVTIQQSMDCVNIDHSVNISVTGGTAKEIDQAIYLRYARIKILNGEADQTTFRAYMNGRTAS